MANAGVKTLLQSKEIREATDPTSGTHAQPAAPRPLLGLGVPQALAKPAATLFLGPPSAEFPGSTPPPNCCSLKRTFACTNLLLLSLADPDDATDEAASPGPCRHILCPEDNTEPTAPPVSNPGVPWHPTNEGLAGVPQDPAARFCSAQEELGTVTSPEDTPTPLSIPPGLPDSPRKP
ncbi:nascent polypeptide-associated complex subunit alpha, muscle-specific form-like isoform X2 [Grus americana]|uniref:nascent polypeptide-associated complex subunit alpha, muscle-specific form-like isoform X2 n=1 Tax=Grus americana TaxID=9117 RepID=UPI002407FBA9|nr:nascent polypeptide-associated complex subunit alpha, muscle-specific form-like isoform X2 [Grus americana]